MKKMLVLLSLGWFYLVRAQTVIPLYEGTVPNSKTGEFREKVVFGR